MKRMAVEPTQIYRPVVGMTAAISIGIACGAVMPGYAVWAALAALLLYSGIVVCLRQKFRVLVMPLMFCVVAGYLSIQPWLQTTMPANHVSRFTDRGIWRIQGKIVDEPREKSGRWQWVLAATLLSRSGESIQVCGRVKVSSRHVPGPLIRGDLVTFSGRLRTIRNFANPAGFDYRRFMAFKGVHVRGYARTGSLQVDGYQGGWLRSVDLLRARLAEGMDDALADFPPDSRALIHALILGERHRISAQLRERFNRTGVGHVLAISGLHVGMVAALAFSLLRWILTLLPCLRRNGWVRRGASLGSLLAVIAYGLLAGLSPSTQRAMIMVAVFMARYWVGRRHDWLNAMALAALVILVAHPPSLFSISFQLSFAAVLVMILGLGTVAEKSIKPPAGVLQGCRDRFMAFMRVSLLAIFGTLPLVLYYFNQASTIGLLTNLVVVPVVGMLIVPSGLAGVILFPVNGALAALCWQLAARGMGGMLWLIDLAGRWPLAAVKTITPSGVEIVLYYLALCVLIFWRRLPKRGLIAAAMAVLWVMNGAYWHGHRFGRRHLQVTALDVGQGSANLLQFPGGFTALVDGGGFSDNRYFDVGARIIAPLLWRNKIKTLDLVVLTHPNSDHLNGLLYIMEHFNVHTVWSNGEPAATSGFRRWQEIIARNGVDCPRFEQLPEQTDIRGVHIERLGPPNDFMRLRSSQTWRDANNNSLILRLTFRGVSILLTGDIAAAAEAELLEKHGAASLRSTILMAPHHGSGKSSTLDFLKAVQPAETIISCGWENRFGFPHPQVINRLRGIGSAVWSTAEHGAVQILIDDKGYRIRTWR